MKSFLGLALGFFLAFPLVGTAQELPALVAPPALTEDQKEEMVMDLQDSVGDLIQRLKKAVETGDPIDALFEPDLDQALPAWLGVQLEGPEGAVQIENEAPDKEKKKDEEKDKAPKGIGIVRIIPGSPAEDSGLKLEDRVLAFRGKVVNDPDELRALIRDTKPGRAVKFTIRREGKEQDLRVKLGEMPENIRVGMGLNFNNGPAAVPGTVVFNQNTGMRMMSDDNPENVLSPAGLDAVVLRDENILYGKLQSLKLREGIMLDREGASALSLESSGISSMTLAQPPNEKGKPMPVMLQLRDGGWLGGEKFTLGNQKINLTLPGGPMLEIPREKAAWVSLAKGGAPQAYEGPLSLNGWRNGRYNQGKWEYRDGGLESPMQGSIGRRFDLMPGAVDLSFDVTYPGNRDQFTVWLFSGDVSAGNMVPGVVWMNFSPTYISANQFDGQRMNNYSFNLKDRKEVPEEQMVTTSYRILVDRVIGRMLVYVNGKRLVEWKLSKVRPEELHKAGQCLSFNSDIFIPKATFRLSNVRLFPWSGEEVAKEEKAGAALAADSIILSSAESSVVQGQIEQITDEEIKVAGRSPGISRENTIFIRFAAPDGMAAGAPAEPPPATLQLNRQGEFSVLDVQATGQEMRLATAFSNEFILPLRSLRSLRFTAATDKKEGEKPAMRDMLTLGNGSRLYGTFVPSLKDNQLKWRIAAMKEPLLFPLKEVHGIFLSPKGDATEFPGLTGNATVRFSNGDWLPGQVTALDAGKLVLKNELKEDFAFSREMLDSIYLNPEAAATVMDGASGRERWRGFLNNQFGYDEGEQPELVSKIKSRWNFFDGGYSLKTGNNDVSEGIGRELPAFTGTYALHFTLSNQDSMPGFMMQLYTKEKQPLYNLYFNGNEINITRMGLQPVAGNGIKARGMAGARFVQQNRMERFTLEKQRPPGKPLQFSMVMDRAGKAFHLLVDGKNVGKYQMKGNEVDQAFNIRHLSIMPFGGMGACRLSDIWMAPWGGDLNAPNSAGVLPVPLAEGQQKIYLANGDEAIGKIESFHTDHLALSTEIGTLNLPLTRIALLQYEAKTTGAPTLPRLRFYNRGLLSVKDLRIEGEMVQCQSLQDQPLSFPLSLVKEIILQSTPVPGAKDAKSPKRGNAIHF